MELGERLVGELGLASKAFMEMGSDASGWPSHSVLQLEGKANGFNDLGRGMTS